ncbi:LysR substrate-binding domain-containing protein [Vibrio sp. S4M6]|uniref:LysR substrate-binding domain-containing protein n=1 Tax=Vibrio sinus TaxID=2946865 RepID=UPI00202A9DD0|nr:LysR substrate-binding domain-containing protein [Vibrio sinus]MCL9779948.1 LysR substrate-binding domain-containing protein [Vibrio sinus]
MKPWQGVYEFVAVAQRLSFKQAAEELSISPAQISRQINALEQRLGVKLLYRSTRQVSLTESGTTYYEYCREVIEQLEEAERIVTQEQEEPRGQLRITAPPAYGEQVISPLLNKLALQYPQLKIWLQLTNRQIDLVQERFDLAIRIGSLNDSNMIARRLSDRSLNLVASPKYLECHGKPSSIEQLNTHAALTRFNQSWRFTLGEREHSYKLQGKICSDSGQALLNATLQGLGIAQLPSYYVDNYIRNGELVTLLEDHQPPVEGIWAIYPHNRQLSAKVKKAVELFLSHLSK